MNSSFTISSYVSRETSHQVFKAYHLRTSGVISFDQREKLALGYGTCISQLIAVSFSQMPRYVPPRDGGMGMVRPSAFFFVQRRMRFLIFGRSVGLKKKLKQKHHKKSRNRRPWHPKMTLKVNIYIFIFVFVSVFLYAATMLIFQIKRINYCK